MEEREWLTERFEQHRSHLRAVAYRMLGSVSDADDALQEAWLRLGGQDPRNVVNMQAWLTTIVGRVCLNMLRARRARREQLTEVHVPDPVVSLDDSGGPEQEALVADSVGLALLVVLDALSPAERLAFVLHDVFGVPFADIAAVLDRSEPAAQQRHGVRYSWSTVGLYRAREGRILECALIPLDPGAFDAAWR
jgi:RNA polymerase sigma-70 factor, ECF subfamily